MSEMQSLKLTLKVIESTQTVELLTPHKTNKLYAKCLLDGSSEIFFHLEIYAEDQMSINRLIETYNTLVGVGSMPAYNLGYSLEEGDHPIFGLLHTEGESHEKSRFSCVINLEKEAFKRAEESLASGRLVTFVITTRHTLDYFLHGGISLGLPLPKKNTVLAVERLSMHLDHRNTINNLRAA